MPLSWSELISYFTSACASVSARFPKGMAQTLIFLAVFHFNRKIAQTWNTNNNVRNKAIHIKKQSNFGVEILHFIINNNVCAIVLLLYNSFRAGVRIAQILDVKYKINCNGPHYE